MRSFRDKAGAFCLLQLYSLDYVSTTDEESEWIAAQFFVRKGPLAQKVRGTRGSGGGSLKVDRGVQHSRLAHGRQRDFVLIAGCD